MANNFWIIRDGLSLPDGSTSLPSHNFSSDTNTGIYRAAADTLGIVTGGSERVRVDSSGNLNILAQAELRLQDTTGGEYVGHKAPGTVTSSHTYTWPAALPGANSILQTTSAGVLSWITGGTGTVTGPGSSTSTAIARWNGTGGTALSDSGVLIDGSNNMSGVSTLTTSILNTGVGSAAGPVIAPTAQTSTGIYFASDTVGITTSGTNRATFTSTALTTTIPLLGPDGSVTAPSYSFSADTNTGIYRSAADNLAFTTGGVQALVFDASQKATFSGQILNADGTSSLPGYSFSADTDTGVYRIGTNNLGFATNATAAGDISSAQKWTIGASAGTQTHAINGGYSTTKLSGIGGTNAARAFYITGTSSGLGLTGGSNHAILIDTSFDASVATTTIDGVTTAIATANTTGTVATMRNFWASAVSKGATDTITRLINYYGDTQSAGTNNAFIADNITFTGNFFINQSGTADSVLGGTAHFGSNAVNTASVVTVGQGGANPLTGSSQIAYNVRLAATSAATTRIAGYFLGASFGTSAAAFTAAYVAGVASDAAWTAGAGSTITRTMNLYMINQTIGTNNATLTDNATFTGNFFINQSGTTASQFGGTVAFTNNVMIGGATGDIDTTSIICKIGDGTTVSTLSASTQIGAQIAPRFSSAGTTLLVGVNPLPRTASAAITVTTRAGVYYQFLTAGAGATITNDIGAYFDVGTAGTNNASIADNTTFTGNFFINQSGTSASLLSGNLTLAAAFATKSYDTSTPTTGGTVTASANKPGVLITPAGTLATLTIKLPSSPIDGQQYWVASSQQLTAVTWQDSGGTAGNVIGGQTTIGGTNRGQGFVYSSANTKWYAIN